MRSILFVCLGNICRSPLAEGIAKDISKNLGLDLKIDSAGTSNWHEGEPPCDQSIKIAKEKGVDISKQKSRPVCREDKEFDLIIALDAQNKEDLKSMGFENVRLLGEFGDLKGADIPDPFYFKDFSGFKRVYEMIERGVEGLFDEIVDG